MRIIFAISASIWAWLIARCIAFGPRSNAICWKPNLHADTWYRLTQIPAKLPHNIFAYIPTFIAATSFAALYINNDIIHIYTVILLVSEHAFVPIFVAHIHQEKNITLWAACNTILAIGLAIILKTYIVFFTIIPKILLWAYFTYIQLYIWTHGPIQTTTEYQERQPRVMIV